MHCFTQMSKYMKYFDNGVKNMSFKIEDDKVLVKYIRIWKKINLLCSVVPIWEHIFITPILFNIDLTFAILLIVLIKRRLANNIRVYRNYLKITQWSCPGHFSCKIEFLGVVYNHLTCALRKLCMTISFLH